MDKTKPENKQARASAPASQPRAGGAPDAAALQAENDALRARLAELEKASDGVQVGATAATAAAVEASLSGDQRERRAGLAQSGYRLPAEWWRDEKARKEQEKEIARNMPSTDGSKAHKP